MTKWDIVHRYRELAEEGRVPVLTCRLCGGRLISRLRPGDDDTPMFMCVSSHTLFPGDSYFESLEKIIKDII